MKAVLLSLCLRVDVLNHFYTTTMTDVESTQPATEDHVETPIDDGDDAESNVRLQLDQFSAR